MFKFDNGNNTQWLRFERFEVSGGTLLYVFLNENGAEVKVDYIQFPQMIKTETLVFKK
jgi:hypothetical protein